MPTNDFPHLSAVHAIPLPQPIGLVRTGTLSHISAWAISARLGFEPTYDTVPGISDQHWTFRVGDTDCAIWDWQRSGQKGVWSTSGPQHIFEALFGWRAVTSGTSKPGAK